MSADAGAERKARMRVMFNQQAPDYDKAGPGCFAWYGRRLVEVVGIQPGAHVLDVASGRGAVLFPAAEQAGLTGLVTGVDLSDEMARMTNDDARRRGINAQVNIMDAEQLGFPDQTFDAVLCGFGIMFLPNQDRALSEFRRVLRPGGRLGVSTWQITQAQDLSIVLEQLDLGWQREVGWVNDPDKLQQVLEAAGYADVRVTPDAHVFHYADIDDYWQTARGTQLRHRLDGLDRDQVDAVRGRLTERIADRQRAGGYDLEATALIATGTRGDD